MKGQGNDVPRDIGSVLGSILGSSRLNDDLEYRDWQCYAVEDEDI